MNQTLKLSEITVLEQPRKDFSRVDEIAASIEKVGLLQPILVRSNGEGGWILVDGEQRLRAMKKLKREEVSVYIMNCGDEPLTEMVAKEAQMMANLCRADLTLIEKMRGFQRLLENAPAKYNQFVIARRFGYKANEISKLIITAKRLNPEVDPYLSSGQFDWDDFEELSRLPKEFQPQVIKKASDRHYGNVRQAIFELTEQLHFDQVFGEAEAQAAGKIHYKPPYGEPPRTFDKDYGLKIKEEFEARTKKSYAEERAKAKKVNEKQREMNAEQKKKSAEKKRAETAKALVELKQAIITFLKKRPSKEEINAIIDRELRGMWQNDLKMILRAFAEEIKKPFKFTDLSTEDLRTLVKKYIFGPLVNDEKETVMMIVMLALHRPQDAKEWSKVILKASKS